ncbi:hypothetical protein PLANPX_0753 [Lacipirellula parvula]|uniref:Uncharacterized protein n=1 Tax=Lacipirellula parvula TaxID=2650471 RepID=A0A5K7X8Q5_9BACT|nr:hypothetical protein PLANPX_0753 [Lacipirellula parvula]
MTNDEIRMTNGGRKRLPIQRPRPPFVIRHSGFVISSPALV